MLRALDFDRDPVGEEAFLVQITLERLGFDRDQERGLLVAVDHGRNQSVATAGPGAPFAGPVPLLRGDVVSLGHLVSP